MPKQNRNGRHYVPITTINDIYDNTSKKNQVEIMKKSIQIKQGNKVLMKDPCYGYKDSWDYAQNEERNRHKKVKNERKFIADSMYI